MLQRLYILSVLLLTSIVPNTNSHAAWFGDEKWEKRCEKELLERLIFPGSYKRESISVNLDAQPSNKYKSKFGNWFHRYIVTIEFVTKGRKNNTLRNIAYCDFTYHLPLRGKRLGDDEGLVEGNIEFKYD